MLVLWRLASRLAAVVLVAFVPAVACLAQVSRSNVGGTDNEQLLELALTRRGSIDFLDMPLWQVAAALSRQFQIPIVVATKKLDEAGVSLNTIITRSLQDLPLESILWLILRDADLTFTLRNDVLLITTPEDAEGQLLTRVYPVLDLVTARRLSTTASTATTAADYDALVVLILATVQPDSWDDVGGPGGIAPLDNAGVLVVSNTREVHRAIEDLLSSLRRAKVLQGIPALPVPSVVSVRAALKADANAARYNAPARLEHWQLPHAHPAEE